MVRLYLSPPKKPAAGSTTSAHKLKNADAASQLRSFDRPTRRQIKRLIALQVETVKELEDREMEEAKSDLQNRLHAMTNSRDFWQRDSKRLERELRRVEREKEAVQEKLDDRKNRDKERMRHLAEIQRFVPTVLPFDVPLVMSPVDDEAACAEAKERAFHEHVRQEVTGLGRKAPNRAQTTHFELSRPRRRSVDKVRAARFPTEPALARELELELKKPRVFKTAGGRVTKKRSW